MGPSERSLLSLSGIQDKPRVADNVPTVVTEGAGVLHADKHEKTTGKTWRRRWPCGMA